MYGGASRTATCDYWAECPTSREQIALFSPTLDSVIADDDPVRLFDEILAGMDWSQWESEYHGRLGQPPIHPRYLAAAILYGLYPKCDGKCLESVLDPAISGHSNWACSVFHTGRRR